MSELYIKKHGLLYTPDLHTVLGVDDSSATFAGRIPYGAQAIDDEVFTDCPYQSVSIPDSVNHLGARLFANSKKLETVKLSASLTDLPPYLFEGCSSLYKVTMPTSLSDFPEGLFKDCSSLEEIPFRAGIKKLAKNLLSGCSSLKSLIIPNTVEEIEDSALANCSGLESVVFPGCLKKIAENAFAGCNSIHNIRIDGQSEIFFVSEDDGSLCMHTENGDKVLVQAYRVQNQKVDFFKDNVDDEPIEESDDDELEDDDTFFSAEIGASDEESELMADNQNESLVDNNQLENEKNLENIEEKEGKKEMEENKIDSMLADIMGDEKKREESVADVGLSQEESAVIAQTMEVMEDDAPKIDQNVAVTNDELEKLFSKNEEEAYAKTDSEVDVNALDKKAKILMDSVEFSKELDFEPAGQVPDDPDLFVIAENLVTDESGNKDFGPKLIACCKTFARIHDFRHVILLHGLPLDNDEFMQFYFHYMTKKNVILACQAASPAGLSDYCKKICQESRISLDKDELNDQRKRITVKTDTLIKLVIRDTE